MTLFPETVKLIREKSSREVLFIGGGIIPEKDVSKLKEAGIAYTFGPGTPLSEISGFIKTSLEVKNNGSKD